MNVEDFQKEYVGLARQITPEVAAAVVEIFEQHCGCPYSSWEEEPVLISECPHCLARLFTERTKGIDQYLEILEAKEQQLRERLASAEGREAELRDEVLRLKVLLKASADTFRFYERSHRVKAEALEAPADWAPSEWEMFGSDLAAERKQRLAKAEQNGEMAKRIEEALE